jgi:hypothetical protein
MQLRSGTGVYFTAEPNTARTKTTTTTTTTTTTGKTILRKPRPKPIKDTTPRLISKPASPHNFPLTLSSTPTRTDPKYDAKLRKKNVVFHDLDGDDALSPDGRIQFLQYLYNAKRYVFDDKEIKRFGERVHRATNDMPYRLHFIRHFYAPSSRLLGRCRVHVDSALAKLKEYSPVTYPKIFQI